LGAVDGIERPETGATCAPPSIDPCQHLVRREFGAWQHLANEPHDLPADLVRAVCPKCIGIFLCHKGIVWEMPGEPKRDKCLHDKVRDGDRRAVCLCQRTPNRTGLGAAHEAGRIANRFTGDHDDWTESVDVHRLS
jgi:hypothetical protein